MSRLVLAAFVFLTAAMGVRVAPLGATGSDAVRHALQERFQLSHVEVQSELAQGQVFHPGTVLRLQADGVPAKKISCGVAPHEHGEQSSGLVPLPRG
jgi:hypothetical protein